MNKSYTLLVKINSSQPIIRYTADMGELPALVLFRDGRRLSIGLTMSQYSHTLLMASTEPGLYHRVKRTYDGRLVCSCKEPGCDHVHRHPLFVAS